jgi:hypothetical protein
MRQALICYGACVGKVILNYYGRQCEREKYCDIIVFIIHTTLNVYKYSSLCYIPFYS